MSILVSRFSLIDKSFLRLLLLEFSVRNAMINLSRLEQLSRPKVIAAKRRLHNRQRGKMMKSSHQVDFTIGTSWRCRRDHDASKVGNVAFPNIAENEGYCV